MTYRVQCCKCGQDMAKKHPVAIAFHTRVKNTVHVKWWCFCGNTVVIEEDLYDAQVPTR